MSISGFNARLINAEISNLMRTQIEQENSLMHIETNLEFQKRNKGNILTNYNILLAQSKEPNVPENIKKSINAKVSKIRLSLVEINNQIFSLEKDLTDAKKTMQEISNVKTSRKNLFSCLAGKIVAKERSQNSLQVNKEMGRTKG